MSYRHRHADLHQEEDIVPARGVILFIVGVLVASAVVLVWMASVVGQSFHELRPSGVYPEQHLGPRHLVSRVRQDTFDEPSGPTLEQEKRGTLESWGWVDQSRGIVRVPIEEAMDLVVQGRQP